MCKYCLKIRRFRKCFRYFKLSTFRTIGSLGFLDTTFFLDRKGLLTTVREARLALQKHNLLATKVCDRWGLNLKVWDLRAAHCAMVASSIKVRSIRFRRFQSGLFKGSDSSWPRASKWFSIPHHPYCKKSCYAKVKSTNDLWKSLFIRGWNS